MLCKKVWQCYNRRLCIIKKFLSTSNVNVQTEQAKDAEQVEQVEQAVKKTVKPSTYKAAQVSEEIINHLKESNLEHYMNFIPKKLLRKSSNKKSQIYLINRDTAKKFCSMIVNDFLEKSSYVIENNPGLGFLTEELLNAGVRSINLYEKNQAFLALDSPLLSLINKHKKRLYLKELDFIDFWSAAIKDNYENENLTSCYLDGALNSDWNSKPYAHIIFFVPDRSSIALLVHNFFNQTNLFTRGRPVLYLAVQSEVWNRMTVTHDDEKNKRFYLQHNVLLHLFFDYKCFGELPRQSFIPWTTSKSKTAATSLKIPMAVIKLEPKRNAFEKLSKENIRPFWFFLKHCMRSKKYKVIKQFETFAPGCGERLIEENIDITTNFKDLSPQKLLEIFKLYRSLPEYDESCFMPVPMLSEETKNEEEKVEMEEKQAQQLTLLN